MADKGLLNKADDKSYRSRLTLSEEGRKAADFVCSRARAAVSAVGCELSNEERAVMYKALSSISGRLEQLCKDGIPE